MTALPASPVKKSAMHARQLGAGARMAGRDGWSLPAHYSGVEREIKAAKESIAILDASPMGKLLLQGDGLEGILSGALIPDGPPATGGVRRLPSPEGGLLAKLAADEYLVLCNPADLPQLTETLGKAVQGCAHALDRTSGLAGLRLTGPKSGRMLGKLSEFDCSPASFADLSCAQTKCAGIRCTLVRSDLGRLPSYDLYCPREFGEYVWDAVLEAGEEYGAAAAGFKAADRLMG